MPKWLMILELIVFVPVLSVWTAMFGLSPMLFGVTEESSGRLAKAIELACFAFPIVGWLAVAGIWMLANRNQDLQLLCGAILPVYLCLLFIGRFFVS